MTPIIQINELCKEFRIKKPANGFVPSIKSLFSPQYEIKLAIKNLSFSINPGEKVAFLGANGAGKSTAIKMLTGILFPSRGDIFVHGLIPWKQRIDLAHKIGIIFGQRSQLWFHLPSRETYKLIAHIYGLSKNSFKDRLKEITQVLELEQIIDTPVRQLSLGQRMRCEIGATLLHRPSILFLDEPTIGIDINSKLAIRDYLNVLSEREGTTILLTSHDVGDIEHVCERVIILNEGEKTIDQSIDVLKEKYFNLKRVSLKTSDEKIDKKFHGIRIIESSSHSSLLEIDTKITSIEKAISSLLSTHTIHDISVLTPPLEEIIRNIYSNKENKNVNYNE